MDEGESFMSIRVSRITVWGGGFKRGPTTLEPLLFSEWTDAPISHQRSFTLLSTRRTQIVLVLRSFQLQQKKIYRPDNYIVEDQNYDKEEVT